MSGHAQTTAECIEWLDSFNKELNGRKFENASIEIDCGLTLQAIRAKLLAADEANTINAELVEIAKENLQRLELSSSYTKNGPEVKRIIAALAKAGAL